jgi:hypothetical protein
MMVVNVVVGLPALSVATVVEYDSHEGSSCIGAVMQGGGTVGDVETEKGGKEVCQSRDGQG